MVSNEIHIILKKNRRIMLSKYSQHADPIYKELKILKVIEIYKQQEFKLYYHKLIYINYLNKCFIVYITLTLLKCINMRQNSIFLLRNNYVFANKVQYSWSIQLRKNIFLIIMNTAVPYKIVTFAEIRQIYDYNYL